MQGPVLVPFSYDASHPYAPGQHRGVDIGAEAAGETVTAPAAGVVSFAGSVPTSGKSVTIETADGYSVTLTHLGSFVVAKGARVAEQDAIGTIGPSGTSEESVPYLHLGIRVTADPNGYVDPLGLLPPATASGATDNSSTASQPSSSGAAATAAVSAPSTSGGSSAAQSTEPATSVPASAPIATTRTSGRATTHGRVEAHEHRRTRQPHREAHPTRSPQRTAVQTGEEVDMRSQRQATMPGRRAGRPAAGSSRRPVVETAVASKPGGLDAGHEARPGVRAKQPRREFSSPLLELLCNGAAALFALGAALAADRERRRSKPSPAVNARVLHLAPPAGEGHVSRAA